jgi:hypothetical protein
MQIASDLSSNPCLLIYALVQTTPQCGLDLKNQIQTGEMAHAYNPS